MKPDLGLDPERGRGRGILPYGTDGDARRKSVKRRPRSLADELLKGRPAMFCELIQGQYVVHIRLLLYGSVSQGLGTTKSTNLIG